VFQQHAGDGMDQPTAIIAFHQQHLGIHALPPKLCIASVATKKCGDRDGYSSAVAKDGEGMAVLK
jgi:hypothetical protein